MIVTFIYKLKGSDTKYYGKYIGYISDDYIEGLDIEIENLIHKVFKLETPEDITIGIIDFNRGGYDYFSEKESEIFDLYYCDFDDYYNKKPQIYLNGKLYKSQ